MPARATSSLTSAAAPAAAAAASSAEGDRPKKAPKQANRAAELFGYTAENNPFGDSNLNDAFVWKKKIVKDIETGKRTAAPTKAEVRADREALMEEIERARARRTAREAEMEEMERLRAEEMRLKDSEQYTNWEAKEDEFHLKQARQRSFIRIREGRERPVDILAKNLLLAEAADKGEDEDDANRAIATEVELGEPATVFQSLPAADLEQLLSDIGSFIELEGPTGPNRPFWDALRTVCLDEIERAKARELGAAAGRTVAALEAIERDIDAQFDGKGEPELASMEQAIRATIASAMHGRGGGSGGGPARSSSAAAAGAPAAVDVEYWESVLRALRVAVAKAALVRMHEEVLLRRLSQLEDKKAKLAQRSGASSSVGLQTGRATATAAAAAVASMALPTEWVTDFAEINAIAVAAPSSSATNGATGGGGNFVDEGSYSPPLMPLPDDDTTTVAATSSDVGGAAAAAAAYASSAAGAVDGGSIAAADSGSYSPRYSSSSSSSGGAGADDTRVPSSADPGAAAAVSSSLLSSSTSSSASATSSAAAPDAAEARRLLLERRIESLRRTGVLPASSGLVAGSAGAASTSSSGGGADEDAPAMFVDEAGRTLPTGAGEAVMDANTEVRLVPKPGAAEKLLADTEAAVEAALASSGRGASAPTGDAAYMFQDKYRPRKPRYFNRVKTGYDWNKYNQSNYDHDNQPPKTVQGYKFNIFYPDLLDRSKTPTFYMEPADSDEFAIIRFHAGPPYEDVAFKIVNKEWEQAKKHGFKAVFE